MDLLPIEAVIPELCSALQSARCALLMAPPGSGKTTIAPLRILQQPWFKGVIIMLEPRRLAARAAAQRMADLLSEPLGESVGYRVRFDSCVSSRTRIEVVTEGLFLRRLQQDPGLEGVGLVIFDEFHERSLQADLALALVDDVRGALRDDLGLLMMSATLDTGGLARMLDDAPVIEADGRSYPVELRYRQRETQQGIAETVTAAILQAIDETEGDILAFLPGVKEIRGCHRQLCEQLNPAILVAPLYGDLTREAQDHAIRPDSAGRRRVVLATAIAETSLTIEGIGTVVDSGWSRLPRFDPNTGLSRLETVQVSLASADQRAGRAGRLGPGVCYRLWTEVRQQRLAPFHPPEMLDADLAPLALELARWGTSKPLQLRWLDAPPSGAFSQALELLQRLEALDGGCRITPAGQAMAALSLHPRLAHMLLQATGRGQQDLGGDLAALLSERDILRRKPGQIQTLDVDHRLEVLQLWRRQGAARVSAMDGNPSACRQIDQAVKQWKRQLRRPSSTQPPLSTGGLLSLAYPDRIAMQSGVPDRYLLSGGRAVRLPEGDPLARERFLVVPQLDAGRRDGRAYLAAPITLDELRQLHHAQLLIERRVVWDKGEEVVSAREDECLGALLLSSRPYLPEDPSAISLAMLDGVRCMGLAALPWRREAREWQARLCSLRSWQVKGNWPDLSDQGLGSTLDQWLLPWLNGMTRKGHLQRLDLLQILRSCLDWEQLQRLEQLAPTHIQVPSGSRKRLVYQPGEPPVLAVRLQEMFGLQQTPRVCGGEVEVMLHLLSPAQRPIQVTQDLNGFWTRTYSEVKKELKGRYPKHYWPDDPFKAQATARVRPV